MPFLKKYGHPAACKEKDARCFSYMSGLLRNGSFHIVHVVINAQKILFGCSFSLFDTDVALVVFHRAFKRIKDIHTLSWFDKKSL